MGSLLPNNRSKLEASIEQSTSFEPLDTTAISSLWSYRECNTEHLPWLAWALHTDNWDDSATDEQKRTAIRESIKLHRKKGTPWAVKKALSVLGLDIDLIDQHEQQLLYDTYNPPKLDGTWSLDGSTKLMPLSSITGIPQLQHWAQFIVRLNLAEVINPQVLTKLRALIDEWKPASRWPLFVYWLKFTVDISTSVQSSFVMKKWVHAPIWPTLKITTRSETKWQLGRDGEAYKIGGFNLDGSASLGKLYGAVAGHKLRSMRARSSLGLTKLISIDTRPRQRLGSYKYLSPSTPRKLYRHPQKIDGSWFIGTSTKIGNFALDGQIRLPRKPMFIGPKLNGAWTVSGGEQTRQDVTYYQPPVLDGGWQVGGAAQPRSKIISTRIN